MAMTGWMKAVAWGWLLAAVLNTSPAFAAAPAYRVVELGAGTPIDVNSSGAVVGIEGSSTAPRPWIVVGGVRSLLPLPAGETYAMVNRVSEGGVAVGHISGSPLLWKPGPAGYTVQRIPIPAGATVGSPGGLIDTPLGARAVVNYGQPGLFSTPTNITLSVPRPYLHTEAGLLVDLVGVYGTAAQDAVVDMTAGGRMLTANGVILEPNATVTPAPAARVPGYWQGWRAWRFNQKGEMVAVASLATSDGHGELARYSPGSGWFVIETWIGTTYAYGPEGIGEAGDALTAQYGGHMLTTADGQRLPLSGLLLDKGYALSAAIVGAMADDGRIVLPARNPSGVWVAVRLDPAGALPAPPPVSLTGVAHPATDSAPWNAISLAWTASSGASSYIVERKGPADAGFVVQTPGTIQLLYDDTTVAPLTTYSYRVFAHGLGGNSDSSNVVTVLSPPAMDSTPPVARITSPADGAVVVGPVTVSAEASDNVGLLGFEIRVQPNLGNEVLCSKSYATPRPADTLACGWDPRSLAPGTVAQLTAYAYDGTRNYVTSTVKVTYQGTVADTAAPQVSVIEPANNSTVSGTVTVRASAGDNVGVARMEIRNSGGAVLASASGGAIAHAWNTAGLRKGSRQTLTIRAYDGAGNVGSAKLTVRIGG